MPAIASSTVIFARATLLDAIRATEAKMYKKTAGHDGTLSLYLVLKPIYYTHLSNPVSSGDELVVLSVSVLFLPIAGR